jgi:hypothetical protein
MKINEIVQVKEKLSDAGLKAEEERAKIEFIELKKVDPKFAQEFINAFNRLSRRSVDQAYQAAALKAKMNPNDATAIGQAKGAEKEKLIRKFVSAIPADAYKKLGTEVQSGGGRGKYTQYRDGTMRGGGDDSKIRGQKSYDQSRIGKSGVGKFAKDVKDVFFTKDIGKSKLADLGSGLDLGDKIGNLFGEPVKTARSRGA